jgi:hypothetical protein
MSLEPRDQLARDLMDYDLDLAQAAQVIEHFEGVGWGPLPEPGYAEAGMNAVGDSIASLYLSLRARSIPKAVAIRLTIAFIENSMANMLGKE